MEISSSEKATHNNYCTSEAQRFEGMASNYESNLRDAQAKLERLREAKKSLDQEIGDYGDFQDNFKADLQTNLADDSFKGDIRDKFDKKTQTAVSDIKADLNVHQANAASLDAKIAVLEASVGDWSTALSSAVDAAVSFWNSIW
ncbi:hypothetical protein [Streptococcus loxodontisalivarius]|uniref:Chromosome segregation ATPase n=1 Tax=Streptococcus loxodontisalivarius TaxID=1349415 RepID=A0ABS2PSX2_9STRE|nr:hypothetical protein [Streptococcus loxodontisalivarius]MBM7643134.1 chromosome segregation ATPase [Streptococcus loxodontisalivarius]